MAEMLPWLVAPRNKEEMDQLHANMAQLSEEMFAKFQMIAAQMNIRLVRPKTGSKWAEKLAWARIDLKIYARSVTKPIANAGAAAVAIGKAWRLSYQRYYDIQAVAKPKSDGSGSGFDFS